MGNKKLFDMNLIELKKVAAENEVSGYQNLRKVDLIQKILEMKSQD